MMTYFLVIILGVYALYALRNALLILQNRRDAIEAAKAARRLRAEQAHHAENQTSPSYIIQQSSSNCKTFKSAS